MAASPPRRVVLTGLGVLTPIGLDAGASWQSLLTGRSGVRALTRPEYAVLPVRIAAEMPDFDAKKILNGKEERKALKMMARTVQMGVACAKLAFADCGADRAAIDSARFGVEIGASLIPTELDDIADASAVAAAGQPGKVDMARWGRESLPTIQPLWMLKYLPNMIACHVSIFNDAQGPNNSITETDVASLLALGEACRIIRRNQADLMFAGAADSKLGPLSFVRRCLFAPLSRRNDDPAGACRPFDRNRDGEVIGEGAGMLIAEELGHAQRRGARIYAEVLGFSCAFDRGRTGAGIARAVRAAMGQAGIGPGDLDHVNAHGAGTHADDAWEARGLCEAFGSARPEVPVFAAKSYFGNLSSAGSTTELAASLLALRHGIVPATLNYTDPDPDCPLSVSAKPRPVVKPFVLKVSLTDAGQCAALVVKNWEEK